MNDFGYNQFQNPFMQPQNVGVLGINKVHGFESAKSFRMGANQEAVLFDLDDDYIWIKTTDSAGFPSYKWLKFSVIDPPETRTPSQQLTAGEIREIIREEIQNYGKQSVQQGESDKKGKRNPNAVSRLSEADAREEPSNDNQGNA